jgi:hypothetical protein
MSPSRNNYPAGIFTYAPVRYHENVEQAPETETGKTGGICAHLAAPQTPGSCAPAPSPGFLDTPQALAYSLAATTLGL